MTEDFYKLLGVQKNATQDQIKQAYRELALKYHPDRNKDKSAEDTFKKINEAYAVLGDPEKRKQYDMMGSEAFNRRYTEEDIFRGFNFQDIFKDMGVNVNFGFGDDDIFNPFGSARGRQGDVGQSILYKLSITLQEAAQGVEKEISLKHSVACSRCKGTGGEPDSEKITCPTCEGSGYQRTIRNTILGRIQTMVTCPRCGGRGQQYKRSCRQCNGNGREVKNDRIKVNIPHGVMDNMRLKYEGMGDYGMDSNGDLYIEIEVKEDKTFTRDGDDIYTQISIPFYKAILGAEVDVPTLFGSKKIRIEPGTQPNTRIALKREGIRRMNSDYKGNEIVEIKVHIPEHLSKEESDLILQYKKMKDGDGEAPKRKFF